MEFEWDPVKSDRCLRQRGFAFADILPAFTDPRNLIEPNLRFDYGEERYQLFGHVRGRLYVIVFTRRGSAFRVISDRKANARDQRHARGWKLTGQLSKFCTAAEQGRFRREPTGRSSMPPAKLTLPVMRGQAWKTRCAMPRSGLARFAGVWACRRPISPDASVFQWEGCATGKAADWLLPVLSGHYCA